MTLSRARTAAAPRPWLRSLPAVASLLWKPLSLPYVAACTPTVVCTAVAICTWPLVLTFPVVGGGPDEPYKSWSPYLWATVAFAGLWLGLMLFLSVPLALFVARQELPWPPKNYRRAALLSVVPLMVPAALFLPLQVTGRACNQLVAAPAYAQRFALFAAPWWALGFFAAWASLLVWSCRRLGTWEALPRRGHCAYCGYDRTGLARGAACPECGHRAA